MEKYKPSQSQAVFSMRVSQIGLSTAFLALAMGTVAHAQQPQASESAASVADAEHAQLEQESHSKRIFGIIPNYRSTPETANFTPIGTRKKFSLATQDSFDRGTFALAAVFAAESQLTDSNHSFGQGAQGFGKYFAASYADFAIGDYMTEAIFPAFLHQDPRYFSRLRGSGWSRLGYSATRVFITKGDNGKTQFNFSEVLGNAAAAGISNLYYKDNRTIGNNIGKLGTQIAVDAASNILKEFWPDVARKFSRKRSTEPAPGK